MNYLIYLFFFLLLSGSVAAQDKSEYTYQPFIMDGTCEWQSREYLIGGTTRDNRRVISNEDSVYQGKSYKKIYDYPSCSTNEKERVYAGIIREENKRVYFVSNYNFWNRPKDTECLLYDFNMGVGDEITYPYSRRLNVSSIDTIQVEGVWRRKFYFVHEDYPDYTITFDYWLEGIGGPNFKGIIDPFAPIPTSTFPNVKCVKHGDQILYKQHPEEECPCVNLNVLSPMKEESRISFYVKDQKLCINAPDQVFTTLKIYSSDGKLVKSVSLREQTDEITSSLEGLTPGSYLFIVGSSDSQQAGQFVVR